jgi:hypothetical protein
METPGNILARERSSAKLNGVTFIQGRIGYSLGLGLRQTSTGEGG